MKTRYALVPLLALSFLAENSIAADSAPTPQELFESKCSVCHPTSRPLGKNKDRANWEATVKRMQGKQPGLISDAEAAIIVDYLTATRGM